MTTTRLKSLAHRTLTRDPLMHRWKRCWRIWGLSSGLVMALTAGFATPSRAADPAGAGADSPTAAAKTPAASAAAGKNMSEQLREAVERGASTSKRLTLVINGKEKKYITIPAHEKAVAAEVPSRPGDTKVTRYTRDSGHSAVPALPAAVSLSAPAVVTPQASRQYIRARAAALTGHDAPHEGQAQWAYEGTNGPRAWGKLKPDFSLCAIGKRQSPINIEESGTLQGPATALQFNYQPSSGSVVNNGHTIQVDIQGDNSLTVRGSSYKLVEFHFHHPSEERVNFRGFAMVAHLLHKNAEGQLAMLAVLLDAGVANPLINKVWTYMPLDTGDRVPLPTGLIDLNELLPQDQRYYQFMGSLTTPPCTEGVLWLVLKQPSAVSPQQIKLFSQLFPNNARPVQALNGRAVRDAQ